MPSSNVLLLVFVIFLLILFIWQQSGSQKGIISLEIPTIRQFLAEKNQETNEALTNVKQLANVIQTQVQAVDVEQFSPEFGDALKDVRAFYQSQAAQRHMNLETMRPMSKFAPIYNALAPEVYCMKRVRVGGVTDGGKWACNPWATPENCTVLSLGLNNQVGFDDEFQQMTGNRCRLLGFDSAEQTMATKEKYSRMRGTTKKALISTATNAAAHQYTISDLVKEAKATEVEILKIDIEGAEHTALEPFLKEFRVCQIYIELHGAASQMYADLKMMANYGYRIFSYEINGVGLNLCEFGLIHDTCIVKYDAISLANYVKLD